MSILRTSKARPGKRRSWRSGIAALEFALLAPVIAVFGVGVTDITNGWIAWRHVTQSAESIAEIATALAVQIDGSNSLTYANAQTASSAIYAIIPTAATGKPSDIGVTLSVVVFSPTVNGCTSGCTYNGNVAWSSVQIGSGTTRPCGALTAIADTAAPSPTTLPTDVFGQSSLLVVDVVYTYRPQFLIYFTGPFTMTSSAYVAPRSGLISQWTRLSNPSVGDEVCAGYS